MATKVPAVTDETHRAGRPLVLVADPIHEAGLERLWLHFSLCAPPLTQSEIYEALPRADAVVVRVFKMDAAAMDRAPRLRLIAKHGSGVDNIDVPAATERGILVANTSGGANASAVAEGAIALMLAVLRRITNMDRLVREGRYGERWTMALGDLGGRSVGLVGFGKIARNVARICAAGFGARVIAYDPHVGADEMNAHGIKKADALSEVMAADVVSVHVPLGATTHHIVGATEIAAMQPTGILVNTSRGSTVDEAALVEALRQGSIAGAGIDVFEIEPPRRDNPLLGLDNVILSPHVAGVTESSLKGTALAVAEVIEETFKDRPPCDSSQPRSMEVETLMKPIVYTGIPTVDPQLLERAKGFAMSDLHEGLGAVSGRLGLMLPGMRPLFPGARMVGQAVTCFNYPGDNLMLHQAMRLAEAGQVIVATNGGSHQGALWGEMVTIYAQMKGLAGAVVDGAVRDTDPIRELGFPLFSTAISASHPEKRGPGSANVPISCAGIVVNPGDVIVADGDGVLAVPPEHLRAAMDAAQARIDKETEFRKKLAEGGVMFDLLGLQQNMDAAGIEVRDGTWDENRNV